MKFSFLLRGQKGKSMHLDAGLSYFVLSSVLVRLWSINGKQKKS